MSEWFCKISDREIGPLSSQQLKAMADRGQIAPTDHVRQGAAGPWAPASRVRGLFAVPAPPSIPQPPSEAAAIESPMSPGVAIPPPPPSFFASAEPNVAWSQEPVSPPHVDAPVPNPAPFAPPTPPPPPSLFTSTAPSVAWAADPMPPPSVHFPEPPPATSDDAYDEEEVVEEDDEEVEEEEEEVDEEEEETPFGELAETDFASARRMKGAMTARAHRKRQQTMLLVGSLIFAAVGGIVATLFLVLGDFSGGPPRTNPTANNEATSEEPSARSEETPTPKKPKTPVNPVEAAGLRMIVGDVPVQLMGLARGTDASGKTKDSCLLITVDVKNPSAKDKMNFTTWSGDGIYRGALLTDGHGKAFAPKAIFVASVLGREVPGTVAPGGSVRDVLAFEMPGASDTKLELELPGEPFGKNAAANFVIPMELLASKPVTVRMVPVAAPKEDGKPAKPAKKKRPPPKPGTPEYDFGLDLDDDPPH